MENRKQMSDEEIQPDIPDHYAFEPMPYFEPSKELLKAYHRELEQESKIAEFVKKRMDHLKEVLDMIFNDE